LINSGLADAIATTSTTTVLVSVFLQCFDAVGFQLDEWKPGHPTCKNTP